MMHDGFSSCRACGHHGPARVLTRATGGAWLLAVLLGITVCGIPFFWIPLVLMRDRNAACARCLTRMA